MSDILDTFFNAAIAAQVLPFLADGLFITLQLSLLTIPLGLAGGLALALLHLSLIHI